MQISMRKGRRSFGRIATFVPLVLLSLQTAVAQVLPEGGGKDRLKAAFAPVSMDFASFSADGRFVAYTVREQGDLSVVVASSREPSAVSCKVKIGSKAQNVWSPPVSSSGGSGSLQGPWAVAPELKDLIWLSEERIVVFTNSLQGHGRDARDGAVLGFNRDGAEASVLATAAQLKGLEAIALDAEDPAKLMLKTGRDRAVLFDPFRRKTSQVQFRRWDRAVAAAKLRRAGGGELAGAVKHEIAGIVGDAAVDVLAVHPAEQVAAVRVQWPADPGRLFLYQRTQRKLFELGSCWSIAAGAATTARHLTAKLADGRAVDSVLVTPVRDALSVRGLVVFCPDKHPRAPSWKYRAEVRAFAELGYAVLLVGTASEWAEKPGSNREAEIVEMLVTTSRTARAGLHIEPDRVVLAGFSTVGCEIAQLSLLAARDEFRHAVLVTPPIRSNRVQEKYEGLVRWRRVQELAPIGSRHLAGARVFCAFDAGASSRGKYVMQPFAVGYCRPVSDAGANVEYHSLNHFGAVVFRDEADWTAAYLQIGAFLDQALRPVAAGASE